MSTVITFIIPVRHQSNAKNWSELKANLSQTIRSILSQTNDSWRAIIVANSGADLPHLPKNFRSVSVDFEPNPFHNFGQATRDVVNEFVRLDKGRRVLAGLLAAQPSRYMMVVDDDDLISNKLVEIVSSSPDISGWTISDGYIWHHESQWMLRHRDFSRICGTSHIIRSDLYRLPSRVELADKDYIKDMLGSHISIRQLLAKDGHRLTRFPICGAIYRVGHMGSHSNSQSLLRKFVLNRRSLKRPLTAATHLINIRRMSPHVREEFFGDDLLKAK